MSVNLICGIIALAWMVLAEILLFISNFNATFLALTIISAIVAFYDLCKYSEELNKEDETCEFV